jgi:hypothetical protein
MYKIQYMIIAIQYHCEPIYIYCNTIEIHKILDCMQNKTNITVKKKNYQFTLKLFNLYKLIHTTTHILESN